MQKNNKKTYKVTLAVTAEKYLRVSAENSEDAIKEAARIFRDELIVQLDKSDVDYVFISITERLADKTKKTVRTSLTGFEDFEVCRLETALEAPDKNASCNYECDTCHIAEACPEMI